MVPSVVVLALAAARPGASSVYLPEVFFDRNLNGSAMHVVRKLLLAPRKSSSIATEIEPALGQAEDLVLLAPQKSSSRPGAQPCEDPTSPPEVFFDRNRTCLR